MYLEASVRPSVRLYVRPLMAKSNKSHYPSKVFVCVSVISGCMRIIAQNAVDQLLIFEDTYTSYDATVIMV